MLDDALRGVHGAIETGAFRQLPPFPEAEAAHLCRLVLMRILPAAVEGDISTFGQGIGELQRRVGDHFAPFQGGRYASAAVADALVEMEGLGVAGVGQSSWGPTGFGVVGSEREAQSLIRRLARPGGERGRLRFVIARGRNRGAEVGAAARRPAVREA